MLDNNLKPVSEYTAKERLEFITQLSNLPVVQQITKAAIDLATAQKLAELKRLGERKADRTLL